jgi:hypothetical protein
MDRYSATSHHVIHRTERKVCMVCGGSILWRRLATNWDKVIYCSASCRRISVAKARTAPNGQVEVYDHSAVESVASAA